MNKLLILIASFSLLYAHFAEAKFSDLSPIYPYYDAVQNLKNQDIIRGYDDETFRPEAPINRAEFLKIIVQSFPDKFEPCNPPLDKGELEGVSFTDVHPDSWFAPFVCQAAQKGIVKGYSNGNFHPERFLNVAEAAKILSLVAELPNFVSEPWFQIYLQNLEASHALLPSFNKPDDLINRGEVAELVDRISNNVRNRSHSAYDTTNRIFVPQVREEVYFYPQKLSLPGLKNQKLIGTDFSIDKKISETDNYTKYKIRYTSNRNLISGIILIPKCLDSPLDKEECRGDLLVLNHGYYSTDIYKTGGGMKREQEYFVNQGFIVLHSDYRGHADSDPNPEDRKLYDGGLGYTMDVYNIIQAFQKYVPNSPLVKGGLGGIYMLGHSMGGAITQNIITLWPELLDGAVLYASSGGNAWNNYERWWYRRNDSFQSRISWNTPKQNPWSWNQLSAENFYQDIQTPLLIFHGTADAATNIGVPIWWSDRVSEKLETANKNFKYTRYPGQGHIFTGWAWTEFVEKSRDFFLQNTEQ